MLLLVLIVSPLTVTISNAPLQQTTTQHSPERSGAATAEQVQADLIIPVLQDEAVSSGSPFTNYDGNTVRGGLFVGKAVGKTARSWLMFNLSSVDAHMSKVSVTLHVHLNDEYNENDDLPIGVHYCANDSWRDDTITWDNQPLFTTPALDVIDSPAAPDMFVKGNWYEFDVTEAFNLAVTTDKVLTLVLALTDEASATGDSWKYFTETEYFKFNQSYLAVTYNTPAVVGQQVDGRSSSNPMIEYIQDTTPTLSWATVDADATDRQTAYSVQVFDSPDFGCPLWATDLQYEAWSTFVGTAHHNLHPFATTQPIRWQYKIPAGQIDKSGVIDKLYFYSDTVGTAVLHDVEISFTSIPYDDALTTDFEGNFMGMHRTVVLSRDTLNLTSEDGVIEVDVADTFWYGTDYSLLIEIRHTGNTGDLLPIYVQTSTPCYAAGLVGAGANTESTASYAQARTHSLRIEFSTTTVLSSATGHNLFPFGTDPAQPGRFQVKYPKSMISQRGFIDRIYFGSDGRSDNVTFENFRVRMVETADEGPLGDDPEANLGGATPVTVLNEETYSVWSTGMTAMIDVEPVFEYQGLGSLIIDIQWDSLLSGELTLRTALNAGGSRYFNVTFSHGVHSEGSDNLTYAMWLDFEHREQSIEFGGTPLNNNTAYWWRVRVRDTAGFWSDWSVERFNVTIVPAPMFTTPEISPASPHVGETTTISLDVTHPLGIHQVLIEIDGVNYSMTASGDTYSYEWTPSAAGTYNLSIYMESLPGTWNETWVQIEVLAATTTGTTTGTGGVLPGGLQALIDQYLYVIVGLVVIVIVIIVLVKRRR